MADFTNKGKFKFTLPQSKKDVEYLINTISGGDMSLGIIDFKYNGENHRGAGTTIEYEPLQLTLKIDSEFKNFRDIVEYIQFIQTNQKDYEFESTIDLYSKNNKKITKMKFSGCWFSNMTGLEFGTIATTDEHIQINVTMQYDKYEFV